ncbi:MAG: M48 family metallopeptidase [Planctomycetota bacterium]
MDFFQHQEAARKKTGRLVLLFLLAVACTTALLFVVVTTIFGQATDLPPGTSFFETFRAAADWRILLATALGVSLVVGGGSVYRITELSRGGQVVASQLGGAPIERDTRDPAERQLLNVVEEMAIASGVPVPPVYVMREEQGINAFAAGTSIDDAVIGVTRGTLDALNRDELQGVIAHEFSHILNGDMRLNVRLMGVIYGLLLLGLIGGTILRGSFYGGFGSSHRSRGNDDDDDESGVPVILVLAVALMVIGYVGTFFGNLIQAAVSRQREYLADASSVQFTRNPSGLAGALKKIGAVGSKLNHPRAAEASHMLFGRGSGAVFASHPPLKDRIRRIDPSFDGDYEPARRRSQEKPLTKEDTTPKSGKARLARAGVLMSPYLAMEAIGRPSQAHVDRAKALLAELPDRVAHAAVEEPYGARAVVYGLLLDNVDPIVREKQLALLAVNEEPVVLQLLEELGPLASQTPREARLPLVELSLPALRELDGTRCERLVENLRALVRADRRIDVFEWALERMVENHLGFANRARESSFDDRKDDLQLLLTVLDRAGREEGPVLEGDAAERLGDALDRLRGLPPLDKKKVLEACAQAISADGKVTLEEGELFRALADGLGCPVPPLLEEPLASAETAPSSHEPQAQEKTLPLPDHQG